ncbi:unnamed protein product [Sphagnum balticum]
MGTFSEHLANGLSELGHEVEVIALAKDMPKQVIQDGIKVHRVKPTLTDNDLGLLGRATPYMRYVIGACSAQWKKFVEIHAERPFDVVDTPEHLAEGFFVSLSKVAPLVIRLYTPHSKFIAEAFHNVSPRFDHQCVAMIERAAMLYADALTSPSRDLAEFVAQDLNYPLDKIRLIYNPIDPKIFCPEGDVALEAEPDRLKVVFVGRLEERKGIKYLVHAIPEVVRAVPRAHFYIIGDDTNTAQGQTSALAELKAFIREAKCESSITFIPRVPLTSLPALYRSADISVVPSVYDNSPYTALEAMSCGRCVIGTTGGGTKEYMVDGESGALVEPKDVAGLTRELIRLLTDDHERLRLGRNARQRVLDKFQRTEIARQTAELYHEAIDRYRIRQSQPLYANDYREFLSDASEFSSAFNLMLHDELYKWSLRYRAANFFHSLRTRPRYFVANGILTFIHKLFPRWSEEQQTAPAPIAWLQQQVLLKREEAIQAKELATTGAKQK